MNDLNGKNDSLRERAEQQAKMIAIGTCCIGPVFERVASVDLNPAVQGPWIIWICDTLFLCL